jgi:hypothetical protein
MIRSLLQTGSTGPHAYTPLNHHQEISGVNVRPYTKEVGRGGWGVLNFSLIGQEVFD